MGWFQKWFNPATGKEHGVAYPGFTVDEFVASHTQTNFDLSVNIDSESFVEFEIDGRGQYNGSHYTVDYNDNKIITASEVNEGSLVIAKIYNK